MGWGVEPAAGRSTVAVLGGAGECLRGGRLDGPAGAAFGGGVAVARSGPGGPGPAVSGSGGRRRGLLIPRESAGLVTLACTGPAQGQPGRTSRVRSTGEPAPAKG